MAQQRPVEDFAKPRSLLCPGKEQKPIKIEPSIRVL